MRFEVVCSTTVKLDENELQKLCTNWFNLLRSGKEVESRTSNPSSEFGNSSRQANVKSAEPSFPFQGLTILVPVDRINKFF